MNVQGLFSTSEMDRLKAPTARRLNPVIPLRTEPIHVLITGAAGRAAYFLAYMIARGHAFGPQQTIVLRLYDLPETKNVLEAIAMELSDCILYLLESVDTAFTLNTAFPGIDCAFLLGGDVLKLGMLKRDLIPLNAPLCRKYGKALERYAPKHIKVLVAINPANTNAVICSTFAPSIPQRNFSATSRLDQNRCTALVAAKLRVPVAAIDNVIVWGNHSDALFADVSNATITNKGDFRCVVDAIGDEQYLRSSFQQQVQERGVELRKHKSSRTIATAKAACDQMRDWWLGTSPGLMASMAVMSDGSYGVPRNIIYSFPVVCADKEWSIVQHLPLDEYAYSRVDVNATDLVMEKSHAMLFLQQNYDDEDV